MGGLIAIFPTSHLTSHGNDEFRTWCTFNMGGLKTLRPVKDNRPESKFDSKVIKDRREDRLKRRAVLILALFLFAILQIGCAAVLIGGAVGAGSVIYVKGEIEHTVNASTPAVYHATVAALRDMQMPIAGDAHDNMSVEIKSQFADGKTAWIKVTSVTAASSRIEIRVGTFGDEYRSRTLLDKIEKNLSS